MPATAVGAPYPALSDPPNGAAQIQALAEWVDDKALPRFTNTTARDAAIPAPVAGQLAFIITANRLQLFTSTGWKDVYTPLETSKSVVYQPKITLLNPGSWYVIHDSLKISTVVPYSGALAVSMYSAAKAEGGNPRRDIHVSFYIYDAGTGTTIVTPQYYKGAMNQGQYSADGYRHLFRRYIQGGLTPGNTVMVALLGNFTQTDSADDEASYIDSSLTVEPFNGTVSTTVN